MKKIPTIFERDWNGDKSLVVDQINPAAQWVFDGEGVATRKIDGTCCLVKDGKLWKRREIKPGKEAPSDFVLADHDEVTGKKMGWVPVGDGPDDAAHREAWDSMEWVSSIKLDQEFTCELLGPKIQGNPERCDKHILIAHSAMLPYVAATERLQLLVPRTFDDLRAWLEGKDMEGIVFHHPDGRMAKIKLRDFGLKRVSKIVEGVV